MLFLIQADQIFELRQCALFGENAQLFDFYARRHSTSFVTNKPIRRNTFSYSLQHIVVYLISKKAFNSHARQDFVYSKVDSTFQLKSQQASFNRSVRHCRGFQYVADKCNT